MVGPNVAVRGVLISSRGELLCGLKTSSMQWELPGGKVEDDETVVQACIRETFEETGVVCVGAPLLIGHYDSIGIEDPSTRWIDLFFAFSKWEGFPRVTEDGKHMKWNWFPYSKLPEAQVSTGPLQYFIANFYFGILEKMAKEDFSYDISKTSF